jgi:hypothetical protein
MSWERPDRASLTFECDECHDTVEFTLDRDASVDFVVCLDSIKEDGWIALKDRDWSHYCSSCADAARAAWRRRRDNERERDRLRAKNSN